jgi:hypothetical protein
MGLQTAILVIGLAGALLLLAGLRRLWRRRLLSGGGEALAGVVLLLAAGVLGALALNLYTYHRLTAEQEVADLHFRAISPQRYEARLSYPGGETVLLELLGDQWQLDARILKWRGYGQLLGLDTAYRLERLSGRYERAEQERLGARSVYRLSQDPGLDLWALAQRTGDWLPVVDTLYGGGAYMPMAHEARYRVTVTASGLVARPDNDAARTAVGRWR